MKFFVLLLLAISNIASASVLINLINVPNDKKIYLASLSDGKRVYAEKIANNAVIGDDLLNNDSYLIGAEGSPSLVYCIESRANPRPYVLTYTINVDKKVDFKIEYVGEDLIAICKSS